MQNENKTFLPFFRFAGDEPPSIGMDQAPGRKKEAPPKPGRAKAKAAAPKASSQSSRRIVKDLYSSQVLIEDFVDTRYHSLCTLPFHVKIQLQSLFVFPLII